MIRAYDEYGNIIDFVEWKKQIRKTTIDDFVNNIKEELDRFEVKNLDTCVLYDLIDRKAEQLKAGGDYERLEKKGRFIKLPCKVGDTICDNDFGKPCIYTITGFSFGTGEGYIDEPISKKEVIYYYSNYSGSITGGFVVSEIGKTVFLTKSEAEQKLKEMESD